MIRIYLVRHGETEYNRLELIQGSTNADLTKNGEEQACRAGQALTDIRFDHAFSGNLKRQMNTVNIILEQNKLNKPAIQIDERFNEIDYGKLEGADQKEVLMAALKNAGNDDLSLNEILSSMRAKQLMKLTAEIDCGNGVENYALAYERFKAAIEDAAEQAEDFTNILIVSSGAITTEFLEEYFLEDGDCLAHIIPNGGIVCLEYNMLNKKFNLLSAR